MRGTNAQTGKPLSGIDHLRQSIRDILATPVGTRVMRRTYGSRLYELIDAPLNPRTILELYAATVEAIMRWEPRIQVQQVTATEVAEGGKVSLTLEGLYTPTGELVTVDGIVV